MISHYFLLFLDDIVFVYFFLDVGVTGGRVLRMRVYEINLYVIIALRI